MNPSTRLNASRAKKRILISSVFFLLYLVQALQAQGFRVSLFFGLNQVFEYGSELDYVPAENDFPVTPAHESSQFGAAIAFFPTGNIGLELDTRYTLSSEITLQDPSDLDTVKMDTLKHYSVMLNLVCRIQRGRFTPYLIGGVGLDSLIGEDRTSTSEYGWTVEFIAPEKKIDLASDLGAGVFFSVISPLELRFDVRYFWIFAKPDTVRNLNIALGVSLGF